jgi:hypothetical protein
MARWYKPDATGNNDGSSLADAWTDLQTAVDTTTLAASPLYLCARDDGADIALAAQVDFNTNPGTAAGGHLRYIGCNAAGVETGARTVFAFGGLSPTNGCFYINGVAATIISLENIGMKNCSAAKPLLKVGASCYYGRLINMRFDGPCLNGVSFTSNQGYGWFIYDCYCTGSTGYSFAQVNYTRAVNVQCIGNARPFHIDGTSVLYGCVFHDTYDTIGTWGAGLSLMSTVSTIVNCIVDGSYKSAVGIGNNCTGNRFIGCRFTNHNSAGAIAVITSSNAWYEMIGCSFFNNNVPYDALGIELLAGPTLTSDGYLDKANHDFSLLSNDPGRSQLMSVLSPHIYMPSGLPTRERPVILTPSVVGD